VITGLGCACSCAWDLTVVFLFLFDSIRDRNSKKNLQKLLLTRINDRGKITYECYHSARKCAYIHIGNKLLLLAGSLPDKCQGVLYSLQSAVRRNVMLTMPKIWKFLY